MLLVWDGGRVPDHPTPRMRMVNDAEPPPGRDAGLGAARSNR
jgi:hypothetical protein